MRLNRPEFEKKLRTVLRKKYLFDLQTYFGQHTSLNEKLIKLIAALDRKYDNSNIIKEGFPSIFGFIRKQMERDEDETFTEFYLSLVNNTAEEIPSEVVWVQSEDRFSTNSEDSFVISVAKKGKNVARLSSRKWHNVKQSGLRIIGKTVDEWQPWTQTIPLRQVVKYCLLDNDFALKFLHGKERLHQIVIDEIEDFLIDQRMGSEDTMDHSEFVDSLESKIKSAENVLNKILEEEVNELESTLLSKIDKIGTVEKSASSYSNKQISALENELRQNLVKTENQWISTVQMLLERTQNISQFLSLLDDIRELDGQFLDDLQDYFQDYLDAHFDQLYQMLEESIRSIKQSGSSSHKKIKEQKDQLSDYVRDKMIEPIQHLQEQQILTRKAENFSEDLLLLANQVPQTAKFIHDIQADRNPPEAEMREIEWRVVLTLTLREQILNNIQPSEQEYDAFLARILRVLLEIDDIIEINLESALSMYNEKDSESVPDKVAGEALGRLLTKVDDLKSLSSSKFKDIEETISGGEREFGRSIVELLHNGDLKELQIFHAKFKVKETAKDWKTQLDARVARTLDKWTLWSRFSGRKSRGYSSRLRKFFGYGDRGIAEAKRADIATYLSETDQKLKELPYIYRRLFKFDEVTDKRFYVPVQEASKTFQKAYGQWKDGFPATFAVVGEKGSGKSTFLDLLGDSEMLDQTPGKIEITSTIYKEEQLTEFLSRGLDIASKKSVDEIIDEIRKRDQKKVVVIDRVENCFVRNINGYDAIEKLCYLISETKEQIFWMISCSRYAWRFLEKVQSISDYFSHIIETDNLDACQIEKIIISRHQASGYNFYFEPGDDDILNRTYRKLQDQPEKSQEYLERKYFERITELADGNASIAMIMWIRSIRDFDNVSFYIRPVEVTSIEMIENLNPQVLFTLAAFVLHDTLSDTDLSMILNLTKEESRLMLIRLRSRGLLLKKGDGYILNHLVYRQVVRGLKERNIIHLV